MTREKFHDLAERVGAYARLHPGRYRLKVTLFAALGYACVLGTLAVCLGGLLFFGAIMTYNGLWTVTRGGRDPNFLPLALFAGLAWLSWTLLRSLFVKFPPPLGRRVQRAEAPALFAMIDEVLAAGRAPAPHTVLLSWDFNAMVAQRPRLGWLGGSRDFLVLGVPLMAALTPLQLKAVVAHEFGHLRGGHGRFANWVYRLRVIWGQILDRFSHRRSLGARIVHGFLDWYAPRFNAYTYAMARAQEFEADRWAAQVAGPRAASEALVQLWVQKQRLQEEFWRGIEARARDEAEVPKDVFGQMLTILDQPAENADDLRRWLRAALGRTTDGTDTHPSPTERLAALGLPPTVDELAASVGLFPAAGSPPPPPSAVRVLLGERLTEFLHELEASWRLASKLPWRQRFERANGVRARLETLRQEETAAPGGELPEAAAWERTRLETELTDTPQEAVAAVARFVEGHPQHASGRFALGRLLLGEDDAAGIPHLEEALRLDGRFTSDGEAILAGYLRRAGRDEEASARRREAIRQADVLDASIVERQKLTPKDRFLPHGLDEAAIAEVRGQLAKEPRIFKAYLARKAVAHFPERPHYVLVCVFRWRWNELGGEQKKWALLKELHPQLLIAGGRDFHFFLIERGQTRQPIPRRVRAVAGSQIFPLPKPGAGRRWWGGRVAEPPAPVAVAAAPLLPAHELPPPLPAYARAPRKRQPLVAAVIAATAFAVMLVFGYFVFQAAIQSAGWHHLRRQFFTGGRAASRSTKEADAARPIRPADAHFTAAEADRVHELAWARRLLLGGYDNASLHDPRWNTAARAFVERSLPWWARTRDAHATARELAPQADGVLRLGCDDPLVLYLAGLVKHEADPQSTESSALLERAYPGFRESAYPRAVARLSAAAFIADCNRRRDGTGQDRTARELWLRWFKQSLTEGSYPPEDQTVLASQLDGDGESNLFEKNRAECCDTLTKAGDRAAAPWLRLWLSGVRHIADAWDARGGDVAANVTAAGWQGFERELALARRDLVASWQLNPHRPEAATAMIPVVMGENDTHGENERLWFDRAITAQLDYHPAYQKMLWSLYPRWGGSHRAMIAFGQACAQSNFYNLGVPLEFQNTLLALGWDDGDVSAPYRDPQLYATLEQVFDGYEKYPAQAGQRVLFHDWHARAAALGGHYAQAYALLRQVDFQLAPAVEAELPEGRTAAEFVMRMAALGGPGGQQALDAASAAEAGRATEALSLYHAALDAGGAKEPRAAIFLQAKIDALTSQQQLAKGEWVSFQPTAVGGAPLGWTTRLGRWRVEPDGSLTGQSGPNGLMIVNDAHVGPDFEMRGEMDFVPGAHGEVQAGVVFGKPDFDGEDWRSLRIKRNGGEGSIATLSHHWYKGPMQGAAVADRNTFVLQSWRGRLSASINGKVIFRDQALPEGYFKADSSLVGLGAYADHGNAFAVNYRNVQLRRLSAAPATLADAAVSQRENVVWR